MENEHKFQNEEIKQMKRKWREAMQEKSQSSNQFNDTYEEVLQDEMMAMKRGFENKLGVAREQINEMEDKHVLLFFLCFLLLMDI